METYLEAQAEKFVRMFDPNCYLYLSRAMDCFDIAEHGAAIEVYRRSGVKKALVIGVESDFLFKVDEQMRIATALGGCRHRHHVHAPGQHRGTRCLSGGPPALRRSHPQISQRLNSGSCHEAFTGTHAPGAVALASARCHAARWIFSRIFGWQVPYSGSVRPHIRVLEPGHAEIEIPDRRANRQHLGSVHAIALLNLAEQASGLALLTGLPEDVRGIVTHISMQYLKKARGTIRAACHVSAPAVASDLDFDVTADCLDPEGDVVARATVRWRLGRAR